MNNLKFTKMHGLGNCFVVINATTDLDMLEEYGVSGLARSICDRNYGIGADGMILVYNSDIADFRMKIINEDGSEAEMCGNGIRCMARYLADEKMIEVCTAKDGSPRTVKIETLAGIIQTKLLDDDMVEVDMGEPVLNNEDVNADSAPPIVVREKGMDFTYVSMGNPHAVAFVDNLTFDWRKTGAEMESSPSFPNRTNVEFVRIDGPNEVTMKVWERGCGETLACGTGACAVAVAGMLQEKIPRERVTVRLPGGPLQIEWTEQGRVLMTGPAVTICRGTFLPPAPPKE